MADNAGRPALPTGETVYQTSPFQALGWDLRFGQLPDGTPFCVADDIGAALDYSSGRAAARVVEEDEKGVQILHTPGGPQRMLVIYEDGLWELTFRSSKAEAKALKKRVKAILAEIRRTGSFSAIPAQRDPEPEIPQTYAAALRVAAEQAETAERLAIENATLKPAAQSWIHLASAEGDFLVGDASKILQRDPAVRATGKCKPNLLFKTLYRELGWIYKRGHRDRWHAKQSVIDKGWMTHRAQDWTDKDGVFHTGDPQVRLTIAGIHELHRRYGGTEPLRLTDGPNDGPTQLELPTGGAA